MRKPLFSIQYEAEYKFKEPGSDKAAKIAEGRISEVIDDPDMCRYFSEIRNSSLKDILYWLQCNKKGLAPTTALIDIHVSTSEMLRSEYPQRPLRSIILKRPLNTLDYVDNFLNTCNEMLTDGGFLWCHSRTAQLKKERILNSYPPVINKVVYAFHYFWHRACPRIRGLQNIYFGITNGKNRTFHRVELMGRAYRAGFEVLDEEFRYGEFYMLLQKVKAPITDDTPSEGPLIKLNRIGKDGKIIGVYKFRTMHPYSEYIQGYIYKYNDLREGGKFANDYRINGWGRLLRATWLDELPMIINVFKGQLKLVGVRPLSRQYFSLYTPEMQQLRIKVKPGLLPPFYYEKKAPETIEEVQASERRYIEAYLKHPFLTDLRYFFGTIWNIVVKRRKSL